MDTPAAERLRLTEIFLSVQGEARSVGWPTVFVRLTGCPLRCQYCDTAYAFHGGEPLAQKRCLLLLEKLCDAGYDVSLETSGAMDIAGVDPRVSRVLDLKTPGSKEMHRNLLDNIPLLTPHDQVKFVICDRADYDWAKAMLAEHKLADRCDVLFSPSQGQQSPAELADWLLADKLPVRFQLQLHKVLWGDVAGK